MYKPYKVEGKVIPVLLCEGTALRKYGILGRGTAMEDAKLLNGAFALGYQKALSLTDKEVSDKLLKIFHKEVEIL